MGATLAAVFFYALSLFALYFVIRLAVRHAIQDAWRERREPDERRPVG